MKQTNFKNTKFAAICTLSGERGAFSISRIVEEKTQYYMKRILKVNTQLLKTVLRKLKKGYGK